EVVGTVPGADARDCTGQAAGRIVAVTGALCADGWQDRLDAIHRVIGARGLRRGRDLLPPAAAAGDRESRSTPRQVVARIVGHHLAAAFRFGGAAQAVVAVVGQCLGDTVAFGTVVDARLRDRQWIAIEISGDGLGDTCRRLH